MAAGGLRISHLSPSAIAAWEQCPLKYYYRYHTPEKGIVDSLAMRYGTAVHRAMEKLGKRLMNGEPLTPQLCDEIADFFASDITKYQISDPLLIEEGQQFIRDRIHRHNPNYRVVGVELQFKKFGVVTNKKVPLNGIVDLALEMDTKTAIVLDYKTSRKAQTISEAKTDMQLSMYDFMFSKVRPQYEKIWLALDYLRNEIVITDRSPEERAAFEQWINSLWETLGDTKEKDVEPNINEFCAWCEYRHLCPAYKDLLTKDFQIKPTVSLSDPKEFAEEWEKVKALETAAKQRIAELKSWADNRVAMDGTTQFEGDKKIVSWSQGRRKFYDPKALVSLVPLNDLPKLITIKNEAVKKYMSHDRPDLKAAIESAERVSPGSPRMVTKNK